MTNHTYKNYVLFLSTAIYTVNFVDRGLMMLLLEPIKRDLGLSDTELGFLTGMAFGLFYALAGLPLARWADRGNRVTIASLSIGLWGLTLMASLVIASFAQFVVARVAAAIGEAGCKPPTYSLIGDYFPDARARTRAMTVYTTAGPLAVLISFTIGGWLNEMYGWRMAFFLLGIPGLILAVVSMLTLVEPRTRTAAIVHEDSMPLLTMLGTLWQRRSLRHLSAALILLYTMSIGMGPWYAAFMIRSHGMQTGELGVWLGFIFSLAGLAGVLIGGFAASRWFANNERGQMRMSALTVAGLLPCFVAFLTLEDKYQALLVLIPLWLVLYVYLGPTYALMQRLVGDRVRATMMSVIMLLANIIGFGIGPQAVGILSDALAPTFGAESLRFAMLAISFIALWAGYHFWQVGRTIAADLTQAEADK